jgi:hypothetical protein
MAIAICITTGFSNRTVVTEMLRGLSKGHSSTLQIRVAVAMPKHTVYLEALKRTSLEDQMRGAASRL